MNKHWTTPQEKFIRDNAHVLNDEKLTAELNITFNTNFSISATRKKRQRMSLIKVAYRSHFHMRPVDETVGQN